MKIISKYQAQNICDKMHKIESFHNFFTAFVNLFDALAVIFYDNREFYENFL